MFITICNIEYFNKQSDCGQQEVKLRADLYHLTMPSQYPDTGGANRLPSLKYSSGAVDNAGSG
jgi:hypothetical protein